MTVGRSFVLRNTHFSKINSGEDLAVFMNVCPERSYQRGDVLFRSGDPVTELHVIAKGQLKMLVPTATGILADHLFTCRQQLADGYDNVVVRLFKVLLDQACRYKIHMPALTAMVDPLGG